MASSSDSPIIRRSSIDVSPSTRTVSAGGVTSTSQVITTPTVPQMARFPTNRDHKFSESYDQNRVVHRAASSPSSSHRPYRAPSNDPVPMVDVEYHTPTAFAVNFIPPFSLNNPYVSPYVATLLYPIEVVDNSHGNRFRRTLGAAAGQEWQEMNEGSTPKSTQGCCYAKDMENLYMSRLLSPPPEMYEDRWELMSTSWSR